MRIPPPLRPGSTIAVVAPASPSDRARLFVGLAWLRTRYRLRIGTSILAQAGYLAGDDARRADELARAIEDPDVDAIVCSRGGYGAMRILDALPWETFATQPKWILGFSDVTALHLTAFAHGVASIHGPNVTGLGRSITPADRLSVLAALEGGVAAPWTDLVVLHEQPARPVTGPVVGGNLALVAAMAGAGRLDVPPGAIVVLEDVTERPYRIDRMLTTLLLGGFLSRAGAIVLGDFTECEPGPDGVTVEEVLRERTASLSVPVVRGAPIGHGSTNRAFVHGALATLAGDRLVWG